MHTKVHVAIDARLPDSLVGGVQQVVCSLAQGFLHGENSNIKRTWIVYRGTNWWNDYIPAGDSKFEISPPAGRLGLLLVKRFPKVISSISPWISRFLSRKIPYDHDLQQMRVDLVHFPFQEGFRTELPYIYHPHDLQHCRYPGFFSNDQIKRRDTFWSLLARNASVVIAETEHVSNDLQTFWNVGFDQIEILPSPPPLRSSGFRQAEPDKYLLYPAAFWPHKNHSRLIDAVLLLKSQGVSVKFIFTGAMLGEYEIIKTKVLKADLADQIIFTGHLSDKEFMNLFENASGIIIPTLFESYSLPIWEAMRLGIPVASSNIDALPNQVGNAGLLFDPLNIESISTAIESIWSDAVLREKLSKASINRTADFTPVYFAKAFCALYQKIIGLQPDPEFNDALLKIQSVGTNFQ